MSDDDQKFSLDISIDLMKVPSLSSFRPEEKETNSIKPIMPIIPYLYEKEQKNGKWISHQKSDTSTDYPFVPPYTYINPATIIYDKDEYDQDAYYDIPPLKWGNAFMCHAFFDMISGPHYGNGRKAALREFSLSITRLPFKTRKAYIPIFIDNWNYYLDKHSKWKQILENCMKKNCKINNNTFIDTYSTNSNSTNSKPNSNTILYGTHNHAIVLIREGASIIVINSGEGIQHHLPHPTKQNLFQLVCKFTMIPNQNDTFDKRWELIKYQMSLEHGILPDKDNLYTKFLAFLQHGFIIIDPKYLIRQDIVIFGITKSRSYNILWDEEALFPNLIGKEIMYDLHDRVMLLDHGFLYGTPQVSGSCTFHSIFWHYIYVLLKNNMNVLEWFQTWNQVNWEFYTNSNTNIFESGTQYSLYRLIGINKSTSRQVLQNEFTECTIESEPIKFIEISNAVEIGDSQSWNETWRTNLTFPDWIYSTSKETSHPEHVKQREVYSDILKYWTNTLTFTDDFIGGLKIIECWEWFYFFHKCKFLFAFVKSGNSTADVIIYLRMGQLIKKLFPSVDNVDIETRKEKLYTLFRKFFVLGAWKPSDINPESCFDEFIQNILPLDKYILPEEDLNNNTFNNYYVELFSSELPELNKFENSKTNSDNLKWIYNKYRNALVLFINKKNYIFQRIGNNNTLLELNFGGSAVPRHLYGLNTEIVFKQSDNMLKSVMTQRTGVVSIADKLEVASDVLNSSLYEYGPKTFMATSTPVSTELDRDEYGSEEDYRAAIEIAKKQKYTKIGFYREKSDDAEFTEEKEWDIIRKRWLHTPDSLNGPSDTALFVWIMNELTEYRTHFFSKEENKGMPKTNLPEPKSKTGCTRFIYQCINNKDNEKVPQNWKDFKDHYWLSPDENDEGEFKEFSQIIFPCSELCKHFQIYCHCFMPELWKQLFRGPGQLPIPLDTQYILDGENLLLQIDDRKTLSVTKINNEKISPLLLNNGWIDQKNILYPELSYIDNKLYYQNNELVSLTEKDEDKKSFLLFQWIQQHTNILKLIVIQKEKNKLYHVRSLHPVHREWYITINLTDNRSLFYMNNQSYNIVWDPSWCSGFLNTIPVLCLERNHQSFLLFLLFKNKFSVNNSPFDTISNEHNRVPPIDLTENKDKYKHDWWFYTEPSIKWIKLDEDRLDINPSEIDENVMFLYIFGVLVQNDAITSRLFSRIWRIFLWYVHSKEKPIYYDIITHVLMKQFYGSPMKKEMIRVAKKLFSFVPCIKHCVKYTDTICERQKIFNTDLFDLNMHPFRELPKKKEITPKDIIDLSDYQSVFNIIGTYLEDIKHIQSKKIWKKRTRELLDAVEAYRPVWEETMDRRYPLLWSILISYDKSKESKEPIKKLWRSMLCNLLRKRLTEIIEYTSEKDTDMIDPDVKIRLLIRLQVKHWYGNLRERPLLLCMFEITAQLVMLNSQFTKSQTLFNEILDRTRPVEHILMGVGKSTVLVPWLTMRILFETGIRAIALIQPVHLTEKCRSIVDGIVMPWITDKTAIVPVNHALGCGTWWNTAKDTRWIIIGSDSDWKNLYLSVRLHKQPWFSYGELAVIYDEYDSMFAPNRSELNYSESPQMHPICPKEPEQKTAWEQWYAETLCALYKGEKAKAKAFNRSIPIHVRHLEKLIKNSESLKNLEWNRHFGWTHLRDEKSQSIQTIIPYLYVGVPSEGSQFTDVDVCLLLTCATYFINGVREHDVRKLKEKWIFMREIENDNLDSDSLYQMVLNKGILESKNNVKEWRDQDLVELYLIQEVLPQNMKMVQSQWNISFVDMITKDLSPHMVGFSGTVQVKDANLLEKIVFSGIHEDDASYKIMNSALAANTSIFIKNDIKEIVNYVKGFGESISAHYAIIDAGSWFREKPIEHYVDDILKTEPTLTVIYLDKEDKAWKQTSNHKTLYNKPYPNETYLYLYDQRHTVGTDIPLPSKIIGVVTVSKNTTFTEVIQGAFRLRSLTKGHQVQMIVNDESILKDTTERIKINDQTRKEGWGYALARQSIRTRHRLIKNHDIPTYHIAIYHPSIFKNSKLWAHAEFKDFTYAPYPKSHKEYVKKNLKEDEKFFSMNHTDDTNMSTNQNQQQQQQQQQQQMQQQQQSVMNYSDITVFSNYEYVSWSKHQYLTEIYPAPEELEGMFAALKISLSPGLLLCLHHRIFNNLSRSNNFISHNPELKNDNIHSRIKKNDLINEEDKEDKEDKWSSATSRIAQIVIKDKKFFLWCTWNEWKLIGCPEVYKLEPEELIPGTGRFAAFLLRYLNDQMMSNKSTETIKKWIQKNSKPFDTFMKLWICKFRDFQEPGTDQTSIKGCPKLNRNEIRGGSR